MGVALWPEDTDELVPAEVFDPNGVRVSHPHVEYQRDPIGWAVAKLGIPEHTLKWSLNRGYDRHDWDGDTDPLVLLYQAIRDWKDAGVESGTGTGKSYGVAVLILWFLACWENALAFTFAPTEKQLKLYIWKNIGELWPRFHRLFPDAELTDLCLRMRGGLDESWAAHGYAVGIRAEEQQVSTRAAGMHAKDMLLVYEEMPGIPQPVIEAGKNTCTAPHNLRIGIGNPNHQLDTLHRYCQESGVVAIRMSALDHPNVVTGNADLIPGAVSQKSIGKRRLDYGELSPVYQSRVRGVSPEQASDSLIRLEWLKLARDRWNARKIAGTLPIQVTGKGIDVANSEHGDSGAICDFAGNAVVRIEAFPCPDSNALGRKAVLEVNAAGMEDVYVGIDTIGVGAGTVNEMRRLGKKRVQALHASTKPVLSAARAPDGTTYQWLSDANVFRHARDQWYWQAREDLRTNQIDVPEDRELWEELVAPTFVEEPQTIVEPKDEIVARLGRSPNKADAFVYANWVRKRHIVADKVDGSAKQPDRARPLVVKDGHLVKPPKAPQSVAELADWAEQRAHRQRSTTERRERLPRRTYS